MFHRSYNEYLNLRKNDAAKIDLCKNNDIILIQVPEAYYKSMTDSAIKQLIIKVFEQKMQTIYGMSNFKFDQRNIGYDNLDNFLGRN